MSLKKKTAGGLLWSGIDAVGLNIVRILITIILARLLKPSDFGLMAMLNIFMAVSETIVQGGFTTALIRKFKVTNTDYSTVFTFNLFLSLLLYACIFFASPLIAGFFKQPELTSITKVVGLVIVFHAFSIVQNISLRRALNFKVLAVINLSSTLMSGTVGIIMAYRGYGVWSLVVQMATKAFIASLLFGLLGKFRLRIGFDLKSFQENFTFGYKILLSNIINTLSMEAYNVIIGKIYSVDSLGFFYQAKRLSDFSYRIISNIFKNVSFPVLSSIQDDENRLIRVYMQFLRIIAFIAFPLMLLLIIVAPDLFTLLLTDKWLPSVPYFQWLCITGMFIPLIVLSGNMPLIKGRSDIFLKVEIYFKIQLILALLITAAMGIKAMVIGYVIHIAIQFFINLFLISRFFHISVIEQVNKLKSIFLISIVTAFLTFLLKFILHGNSLIFSQIIVFGLMYFLFHTVLKSNELIEIRSIIKNRGFKTI